MRKLLFVLIVLFTTCSLQAQTKPAKQRDSTAMTYEYWKYFQSLGQQYLVTETLPVEVKQHTNPVDMKNPVPPVMTIVASTGTRGSRDLGLRQTIVFDTRGNSHLITTLRVR